MYTLRHSRILPLFALALAATAQNGAKRPLHHRDYDGWKSIQTQTLSRDGKFLAYALFPQEGDGQLVVLNIATGKEVRENAGSVPPAPDTANFEAPAAEAGVGARGLRLAFTHDNKYLVSSAFPAKAETDKARKDHKRPDEMPRGSMLIADLTAMPIGAGADVTSIQVPEQARVSSPT